MSRLQGKVALITGAARGQGRNHAVRLAHEGADIIAIDAADQIDTVAYPTATPDDLAETVRQVEALDRRIHAVAADVRDIAGLRSAVSDGVTKLGRLDIVLANAGIFTPKNSFELSEDEWQTTIDVNLTGVWKTVRASVPHIIAGGRGGSVVFTSSLGAVRPSPHTAHYAASKAGLVAYMQVLAQELAPDNIRVNTVNSGTVATPMVLNDVVFKLFRPDLEAPTRADFDAVAGGINKLPTKILESDDVSNAVLYLVSDDSRFVTGRTHVIDAGSTL